LKKARFEKSDFYHAVPPSYLQSLSKNYGNDENMPLEIYRNAIDYLNDVGYLDKIPPFLIRDYVIARCNYMQAHKKFVQSGMGVLDMDKKWLSPLIEAELEMGKNVNMAWKPIWAIITRHGRVSSIAE